MEERDFRGEIYNYHNMCGKNITISTIEIEQMLGEIERLRKENKDLKDTKINKRIEPLPRVDPKWEQQVGG